MNMYNMYCIPFEFLSFWVTLYSFPFAPSPGLEYLGLGRPVTDITVEKTPLIG